MPMYNVPWNGRGYFHTADNSIPSDDDTRRVAVNDDFSDLAAFYGASSSVGRRSCDTQQAYGFARNIYSNNTLEKPRYIIALATLNKLLN